MRNVTLVVISPLRPVVRRDGKVLLTQKFVDGLVLFRKLWEGPILHVCEPGDFPSDNLDNIEVPLKTPDFETVCATFSRERLRTLIPSNSLVLSTVGERYNSVSRICRDLGIPCVYISEYNLTTRKQIAAEYQRSPVHGAWAKLRQIQQEVAQRRAISIAEAIQCNGLPTFNAYRAINRHPLLFFDNRVERSMLATNDGLSHKANLHQAKKLRLAFSGRLNLMKGVDDLPSVASHLRHLGVPFEMSICGDGEYLPQLTKDIERKKLGGFVHLMGNLDFKTELVPFIKEHVDIFICCHRQGDPSCTYIETMACGVPILGYANEAWTGLAQFSNSGWITPMGNAQALATRLAELYSKPTEIHRAAEFLLELCATAHG